MQKRILPFVAVTALVSLGSLGASVVAEDKIKEPAVPMQITKEMPSVEKLPAENPPKKETNESEEALTAWVHKMMTSLAREKHDDELWKEIARDIAVVSLSESPQNPSKVASALTSLAFHEGRFRSYVDEQKCNDRTWRKTKEGRKTMLSGGDCDGGYAYSLWQIHPWEAKVTGPQLKDRRFAAKTAYGFIRRGGWCGYSGEPGPCPKADTRREVAVNYLKKHPFVLP